MGWGVLLLVLSGVATLVRLGASSVQSPPTVTEDKVAEADKAAQRSLKWRYLVVMIVVRFADWLQGPYFYDLYAGKIDSRIGKPFTAGAISTLFLVGFCSSMVFGTAAGSLTDSFGRCGALPLAALCFTLPICAWRASDGAATARVSHSCLQHFDLSCVFVPAPAAGAWAASCAPSSFV